MHGLGARRFDPELKQIVTEASRALALLDADRLEELARACQALNRGHLANADLAQQAREAAGEMAVFARVLDATRANLTVMNRLRELHQGRLDYADAGVQPSRWALPETIHGDH
jgi:hypothetical protein